MSNALLISVRLHEGWYHGTGGPPSPARMFQALVAGVGISGPLDGAIVASLQWLENQPPPLVGHPHLTPQATYVNYVPNNDLDAKQGDPRRIGEIRTKKVLSPLLFDPAIPFLFAWKLRDDRAVETAKSIIPLADHVYQLGRTVDMAWAWADVLSEDDLFDYLKVYPGVVLHPSITGGDVDCPASGSLRSLHRRYLAAGERFGITSDGKGQTFRRRPKPKWRKVSYGGVASRFLLELRRSDDTSFAPWPLERSTALVEQVRDGAAAKLRDGLTDRILDIGCVLIGRKPNGENAGPTSARVQIVPLPSIGHPQADMQIRRILVQVPGECPIRADDIAWAVSGLRLNHPNSGEAIDLTVSNDTSPLAFWRVEKGARIWRSVTPLAIRAVVQPRTHLRRGNVQSKVASEKYLEHREAATAVAQALRHAGIDSDFRSIRLQREPFDQRGVRVEPFAHGTRFGKLDLWHVEIELESLVDGPLLIGNGRFLGLGLMRPIRPEAGVFAFSIECGLLSNPDPVRLAQALRRAVMARVQSELGSKQLPTYFSGHREGSTSRAEEAHLAFVFDPRDRKLLVITPEYLTRRHPGHNVEHLATLERAMSGLRCLRAGRDGCLDLRPAIVDTASHPLFRVSHVWGSLTPYTVNRHGRNTTADTILTNDVIADCERAGLPCPEVTIVGWSVKSGVGLQGHARLRFKNAVQGPVILGRTRYLGGGLFAALDE